ncbi:hypothetical protein M9H77_29456 [Catharanthus roseus]|uniref:Uncharacterized protein n=1 Tax=Catharanthus roseus TaxID=4058 RepID=A0ACB9ZUT1_CATRO|nr:hypothetical protein M9H77_29456 [Catharanthus roseus]
MQVEKAKGTSLEDLEDSTSNGEEGMNPIAGGRAHLSSTVGSWQGERMLPTTNAIKWGILGLTFMQRMEVIGRQEMTYSKLARARSNCYKDGGYDRNAYGGSHHRNGHYTNRRQMGICNFSSRAEGFLHIPYEDCYENSPYDVHKGYHVSLEELKSLLVSYTCHVSLFGDMCIIAFDGNLFLLMPSMSKCLSSHVSLENPLTSSSVKFDPLYYGFRMLDDTSFVDSNIIGFELDCALFDFLHEEYLGKFIEDIDYVFPFLDALMKYFVGVTHLNQRFHLLSGQVEFSYNEHKLSCVVDSLHLLFESTFGFKFYHMRFKDFLLKGFGIQVGVGFEHTCKDFVVELLYYLSPFKEWFSKFSITLISFSKNSWPMFLKLRFDGMLFYHPPFKEFLKKMRFKEGGKGSWSFDHFVSISTHLNFQFPTLVKYKVYLHVQMLWSSYRKTILLTTTFLGETLFKLWFSRVILRVWK